MAAYTTITGTYNNTRTNRWNSLDLAIDFIVSQKIKMGYVTHGDTRIVCSTDARGYVFGNENTTEDEQHSINMSNLARF